MRTHEGLEVRQRTADERGGVPLDAGPVAIVKNRATSGGPQPAEMDRMLKEARAQLAEQDAWIKARRAYINDALAELDKKFGALVASAPKQ